MFISYTLSSFTEHYLRVPISRSTKPAEIERSSIKHFTAAEDEFHTVMALPKERESGEGRTSSSHSVHIGSRTNQLFALYSSKVKKAYFCVSLERCSIYHGQPDFDAEVT